MKEMKNYFRTSYINKLTFNKIFTLYEDVSIYKECMATLKDLFYNPETAMKASKVIFSDQGPAKKPLNQASNYKAGTSTGS